MTALYVVSQSSIVPITKEPTRVKQMNHQLRKNAQIMQLKQSAAPQAVVAKLVITPKVLPTKTDPLVKRQHSLLLKSSLVILLKQ